MGDAHCMFGQKVDWTGRAVSGLWSVGRSQPRDYIITCAKTEEEAIAFENQDEKQPFTQARVFTTYHTALCEAQVSHNISKIMLMNIHSTLQTHDQCKSKGTCRQGRAPCCSDSQCCYGLTCQSNHGPGMTMFSLRTCQPDPEYKFRDPGEVKLHMSCLCSFPINIQL